MTPWAAFHILVGLIFFSKAIIYLKGVLQVKFVGDLKHNIVQKYLMLIFANILLVPFVTL